MTTSSAPTKMKAWQFSSITSVLEKCMKLNPSAQLPPSSLSKDQTLVEVITAALNPVDYKMAEIPLAGRLLFKRPATPGIDYSGRVVSSGNPSLKSGQLVFGRLDGPTQFGTLAQYTVAPSAGTIPLPEGVSPEHAASIGTTGLVAYQCIAPNVKAGDKIFINGGSGGTGIYGIQIAKTLGCHVTTTCSTPNIRLCTSLGADVVIDYKTTPSLTEKLISSGQQFALVVDNVGVPDDLYSAAHRFLQPGGKFVQIGGEASIGGAVGLISRMVRPGWLGGGKRAFEFKGAANKYDDFVRLGEWMREGRVRAVIDEGFAFEDARLGYEKLRTGRARGKIVVRVGE